MTRKSFFAVALGAALSLPALAAEKPVRKSEVPRAALEAAAARYPKAEMTGFAQEEEAGRTVFEIQMKVGGARVEIVVSPEGKIVTEEMTISMKQLPDAVRQRLSASPHAKAKVQRIEKVTEADQPGAPTYEILVQSGKRKYELVFSSTGELKKEEAKTGSDQD